MDAHYQPGRLLKDGKVLRGKDGWLFIADDSNDVLGQHTGRVALSAQQVDSWSRLLEVRRHALGALGIRYLFFVAPNTHAIYEDKLPDSIEPVSQRPIHQIVEGLRETRAESRVVYPLEELRSARHRAPVCCKTDSHWNEFGAFVAYQRMVDEVEPFVPVRRVYEDEVVFFDHDAVATDLAYKLGDGKHASWTVGWLRHAGARLVSDNCIEGRGGVIITECPYADGTCVLVGDSYSWAILKFLAESFRRLVYVQSSTLDYTFIKTERPDVVINLMAERFLVFPPQDVGAPTVQDEARHKRDVGRRRPRLLYWDLNPQPSLYEAEDLRSRLRADGRLRDAAIVSVLAYSGMRPDEVLELRWSDVGPDTIRVWKRFTSASRLRRFVRRARLRLGIPLRPSRVIPLLSPLREALEEWRAVSVGEGPFSERVFPAPDGGSWKKGDWRRWREGITPECRGDWRPQELRNVFCSLLINAGTPVSQLAHHIGISEEQVLNEHEATFAHVGQAGPVRVETQLEWANRVTGRPRPRSHAFTSLPMGG